MSETTKKFKIAKNLTPPLFKLKEGEPRYFQITSPIYVGKEMKAGVGEKKKEPASLVDGIDLETGEVAQMIVSAVVKSVLTESYPNNGYVGKGFEIIKLTKVAGKDYNSYSVKELDLEATSVEPAPKAKK